MTPIILPIWQLWGLVVGAFAFGMGGGFAVGGVVGVGIAFAIITREAA